MDFEDTPEEAAFRAEARAWLDANADLRDPDEPPHGMLESEGGGGVARAQAWQAKKADAGWACITWPKEYGGRAATSIQSVIWNQEEARYRTAPNIFGIGQGMLGPTIMTHGTQEQKDRYIQPMLRGEEIWCQLFSEPAAGSDLAGLRMTAVKDGDDWIVNGQKIWTTGAQYCKWGMIVTRTDPSAVKHAGITYFIVDMESAGIEIRPIKQIAGSSGFNEVFFNDCRIPDKNRVGAVNDGWRGAITTLMNERSSIGGGGGGAGVSDLLRLAKQCKRNGRPAIEDSSVRQQIADFYIRGKGLSYTGSRTLTAISRGTTPGPEASIGKLVGAPLRQQMAAFAIDLQGASGSLVSADAAQEGVWQNAWLGAPGMRLAGGTDEILRNIVAERVLGLPSEMRADKGVPFSDIPSGI
ncbi:MAG: acyl-CoA dehydrogenase family protein [Myxococcota bacterium]